MHKRYIVKLGKDERKELSQLVKKEKIAAKKRTHAQVLLLADCGKRGPSWEDEAIAEACQVTVQTVENIRKRLVLDGLEMALNRKKQAWPSRQRIRPPSAGRTDHPRDGQPQHAQPRLSLRSVPAGGSP